MNKLVKFFRLYIIQVGAIWSALGAITFFQEAFIKNYISPVWYLIYFIPILTSLYIIYFKPKNEEGSMNNDNQLSNSTEDDKKIITHGDFSPAEVGQNYEVIINSDKKESSRNQADNSNPEAERDDAVITTKGNYSPAVVKGDYKVEEK